MVGPLSTDGRLGIDMLEVDTIWSLNGQFPGFPLGVLDLTQQIARSRYAVNTCYPELFKKLAR